MAINLGSIKRRQTKVELREKRSDKAHDNNFAFSMKVNEAAINNAGLALRTALLINGGAAISLITFVGGLYSTADNAKYFSSYIPKLLEPLSSFSWGVWLAAIAMALSYFSAQSKVNEIAAKDGTMEYPYIFENDISKRWFLAETIFAVLAVFSGLASIICFGIGMYQIQNSVSLLKHFQVPF